VDDISSESINESDEPISKSMKNEFSEFYDDSQYSLSLNSDKEVDYYFEERFKIPTIEVEILTPSLCIEKRKQIFCLICQLLLRGYNLFHLLRLEVKKHSV
jgi:hypothetical protein